MVARNRHRTLQSPFPRTIFLPFPLAGHIQPAATNPLSDISPAPFQGKAPIGCFRPRRRIRLCCGEAEFPTPCFCHNFCCFHSKCTGTAEPYSHAFTVETGKNLYYELCKTLFEQRCHHITPPFLLLCILYRIFPIYCIPISTFWQRNFLFFVQYIQTAIFILFFPIFANG